MIDLVTREMIYFAMERIQITYGFYKFQTRCRNFGSKRQTGKTTAIRSTCNCHRDLRSRHHEAQLSDSLKPFKNRDTMVLRSCLRGFFNCSPIMPRIASLSDSRCDFFQSGSIVSRLEKIASAVRETGVFWYNWVPIKDPLKTLNTLLP